MKKYKKIDYFQYLAAKKVKIPNNVIAKTNDKKNLNVAVIFDFEVNLELLE